jgi:hypothetical protein
VVQSKNVVDKLNFQKQTNTQTNKEEEEAILSRMVLGLKKNIT